MLTSARNQFRGKVIGIKAGAVNDEVAIKLPGGTELTAVITCTSTKNLGLAPGKDVIALIKAPWVILATNLEGIRLSARNQLKGTVTEVKPGAVNTEVIVKLAGGEELAAIITNESSETLQLAAGKPVTAIVKASHMILGVAE